MNKKIHNETRKSKKLRKTIGDVQSASWAVLETFNTFSFSFFIHFDVMSHHHLRYADKFHTNLYTC